MQEEFKIKRVFLGTLDFEKIICRDIYHSCTCKKFYLQDDVVIQKSKQKQKTKHEI